MNTDQIRIAAGCDSTTAARWLLPLEVSFHQAGIDSPLERAVFLAQAGYESGGLMRLEENLNYSATRLRAVWPKRFPTIDLANKYAGKPEALANYVYAGRIGNGDASSGDGWKYRGRGLFQVTGHDNYQLVEDEIGIACVDNPDLLLIPKNAAASALAYWVRNKLGALALARDFDGVTRGINPWEGGDALKKRRERCVIACGAFGV